MERNKHEFYFILGFLVATLAAVYFIVQPFLSALIIAAILAFIARPVYQRLTGFMPRWPGVAAFLSAFLVVIAILLPIAALGTQIFRESRELYGALSQGGVANNPIFLVQRFIEQIRVFVPVPAEFEVNINEYLQQGLGVLIENIGGAFSTLARMTINSFVFLVALYFFLRDGDAIEEYIVSLSPLTQHDNNLIMDRLKTSVLSVLKGNLFIALTQGFLVGIGFFLFGVPSAALWGSIAAVAALIPGIGTALVIIPGIVFLMITGDIVGMAGLLIWGVLAVGLIDNFLMPSLVGRGMQLHPLAVFLSVLGGLAVFGPLGFLLGPLVMSLFRSFMEIYATFVRDQLGHEQPTIG